jgi:hypothetical protein
VLVVVRTLLGLVFPNGLTMVTENGKGVILKMIKAFLASLCWTFAGILFGLIQLIVLLTLRKMGIYSFDIDEIFKNCTILFFCSAIVVTSGAEYFIINYSFPKPLGVFLFYLFPLALIVLTGFIYGGIIISKSVDMNVLKDGTYTCFILSIIHSFIFNTLKFHSWGSK